MSESKREEELEESPAKLEGTLKSGEITATSGVLENQYEVKTSQQCTLSFENGSVETTDSSSYQDEDGSVGFVVIKPQAGLSTDLQMEKQEDDGSSSVFIIQNPEGMNIDGLDSDVLSQVQRVLAESGAENSSVMILNEGDENSCDPKGTTTYIIDLNNVDDVSNNESSLSIASVGVNPTDIQQQHQHEILYTSSPQTTSSVSQSTSVIKPLVSASHGSAPTTSVRDDDYRFVSHSVYTSSDTNCVVEKLAVEEELLLKNSVSDSTSTNTVTKNLTQSSHTVNTPSHHLSSFSSTSPSTSSSVTTSQVAEQLIHIAKKMIEDGGQGSQKISMDESLGKIVISSPESQRCGEKPSSESIITMYVSSPNELKLKLKKLKTNSPVIVMQAGEESLSSDENKENPLQGNEIDGEEESTQRVTNNTSEDGGPITQRSDNIVAALSSLTSSGVLYRCSECGYSSHNKHYYKQHVDLVHNEERPYKCPHCDYAGKRRHALLEHMVVHSNQRPYSCHHCNASFRKKGHLTNHVKLHMSHRLVHCGVCNIQLPDAEAFEAHLRKIHNTDKLYKCKLCEHTVVERRAMLGHLATHNESIVFSCPSCSSYFSNEKSLLTHMKDTHDINRSAVNSENDKNNSENIVVGKPTNTTDNNNAGSSSTTPSDQNVQSPNIVCSECGFICTDTQVMKKHMWVHIDSSSKETGVQLKDQAAATSEKKDGGVSSGNSTETNSAMGVLKMNVVSGMKSLPENIVYQCTSCKFTSSDNSVFIKHMLLHKTQRNQQTPVSKDSTGATKSQQDPGTTGGAVVTTLASVTPGSALSTNVTSSIGGSAVDPSKDRKTDSSVPFVFDQPSGRYRCLICGYHCDFQRTIKAHIWKHSGNQNIEYPVFEQAKKPQTSSASFSSMNSDQESNLLPKVENKSPSTQQHQSLKTNSGRVIQLLSFNPSSTGTTTTTKYKADELIQIKENHATITPGDKKLKLDQIGGVIKAVPFSNANQNEVIKSHLNSSIPLTVTETDPCSPPTLIIEDKSEAIVEIGYQQVELSVPKIKLSTSPEIIRHEQIPGNSSLDEGCTEPSVVVEIVDSVPSSYGLTGMKSQQGSPRVSDLEGSGNEVKLAKSFREMAAETKYQQDLENSGVKTDHEEDKLRTKYNLRKPKESMNEVVTNSYSKTKHTATKQDTLEKTDKQLKTKMLMVENVELNDEKISDVFSNEESDGTASSDDTASAGESGSVAVPPKAGICSSLLAVIEQLRERSRSESLSEKDLPTSIKELPKGRSSKRNKKSSSNHDVASSLSEFHNIEKINEGDGEKFRCNLCHYTSHRICNMKIHMKTHRQKKPSECSLCDFASATPELLQEHMLLHCKVRTYACKFCPQSFNHKSTLRAHMRAHKDHEPFLCAYCVFETTNANEYREHMLVHSGCSSRLRCPGCDHVMNSKEELTPHLMICKGKSSSSSSSSSSSVSTEDGNKSSNKPPSNSGGGKSPKHKDTMNDNKNPSQNLSAPSPQPTQHSCVVSGCSFSSFSLKELQDHLSVHCNPSLMVCDLCDFKALHSRSLKSHMKRHANDQRYVQQPLEQYKCNLCGYVCHHLPSLKSHMWRHASDQSYSYEFTNDVINAAIDHDSRVDVSDSQPDDPELLVRFINSESRIMEGELTNFGKGDGQRPTCWVTFRCCSCGFETINKAKLNIHMRSHSDIIQQTLDVTTPRKPGYDKSNHLPKGSNSQQQPLTVKSGNRRSPSTEENNEPFIPPKVRKLN